ncbi:MAG: hypothetical protein ABIJ59_16930 [Pseudomonadota bacterium]
MTLRYVAQSDEQKEGLIDLGANLETGVVVSGMVEMFPSVEKEYGKTEKLLFFTGLI